MARGFASLTSLAEEALMRGFFAINAIKRIAGAEDKRAQLANERTYFDAHKKAQKRRRAVMEQVDAAASRYGPVLGWRAQVDSRTTGECRQANGKNFRADRPPSIGYPGTVHPHCRCEITAPHTSGRMLDS